MSEQETGELHERRETDQSGLRTSEDHELRQLAWFSRAGQLSEQSRARLSDLVTRDRRAEIRDPRPNPSNPLDDDMPSTLPPLELDRSSQLVCPNCGCVLNDRQA